jgi:hypothetical protein
MRVKLVEKISLVLYAIPGRTSVDYTVNDDEIVWHVKGQKMGVWGLATCLQRLHFDLLVEKMRRWKAGR